MIYWPAEFLIMNFYKFIVETVLFISEIMKVLAIIFGLFAVAAAERFTGTIDWSEVKSVPELRFGVKSNGGSSRIVNGFVANKHQFPYQIAALVRFPQGTGLCGGSLISNEHVLIAAHCVDGADGGVIILGAHNISDVSENNTKIVFNQNEVKIHEDWNMAIITNDIAIIKLSEPVEFSYRVRTVQLPSLNEEGYSNYAGEIGTVSGWGRYADKVQASSDILRFVRGNILKKSECSIYFPGIIDAQKICLTGKNGIGACQGDSGGPLVVTGNNEIVQVGVVSFGLALGCELPFPSVFTRVTSYLDWIQTNTDGAVIVY